MLIITIKGDGLNLERQINMHQAGQIISFLSLQKTSISEDSSNDGEGELNKERPALPQKETTPLEEIENSNASTYPEKITVIGNFIAKNNAQECFSVDEVRAVLRRLGQYPSKFSRELTTAVSLGYIYEDTTKSGYIITEKGKKAIVGQFQASSKNAIPKVKKGKRKSPRKKTVRLVIRPEVENLALKTELAGYRGYHELKTKSDKILWILKYAETNDILSLNPKEIEIISTRLKDRITQSGFSAINTRNVKNSFVASVGSDFQLQKKGEDYLKDYKIK